MKKCYFLLSSYGTGLWNRLRIQAVYCNHGNPKFNFSNHKKFSKVGLFVLKLLNWDQVTAISKTYILWSLGFVQVFSIDSKLWLPAPKLFLLIFIFHSVANLVQGWEQLLWRGIWSSCLQSQRAGKLQCSFTTSGSGSLHNMPTSNLAITFTW